MVPKPILGMRGPFLPRGRLGRGDMMDEVGLRLSIR
jgi:hypothetical protein